MASRASPLTQPLTKAAVINQLDSWQAGRALPVACLQGPPLEDEDGWRAVVHFVRYRNGGFMIATPATQTVGDFLGTFIDEDGEPQALTRQVSIRLETNRSKFVTVGDVLLVDLPWFYLDSILKPQILKNTPSDHIQRISRDGVVLRPNAEAAIEASEVWVLEHGGEEIFQEYATAQEDAEEVEVPADQGQGEGEQLLRLQARIAELEAQASAVAPVPARPARDLFPPEGDQHLSPQLMDQLKGLAGPPPNRLGRVETAFMTPTAKPKARTSFLEAEKEAEAIPPDEMDALAESLTDPMQRLLAMQMKQTNMLMNRLAPKQHDVLASALSGGGSEPGSSSGVRGCAARELFLRQLEDSSAIARVVLANAQRALGLPTSSIYGGLMRDYIEKKVPLHGGHEASDIRSHAVCQPVGSCIRSSGRADDGTCVPGPDVRGAVCNGCWEDPVRLATDRIAGTKLVDHHGQPQKAIAATLQPSSTASLGSNQCGLPSRFGLHRDKASIGRGQDQHHNRGQLGGETRQTSKTSLAQKESQGCEKRDGRVSRKLKCNQLFTMSSQSGTEVPVGGLTGQHGLQYSAGVQDSSSCKIRV